MKVYQKKTASCILNLLILCILFLLFLHKNLEAYDDPSVNIYTDKVFFGGGSIKIINKIEITNLDLTEIGLKIFLPEGWSYLSCEGENVPNLIEFDSKIIVFKWFDVTNSQIEFVYELKTTNTYSYADNVIYFDLNYLTSSGASVKNSLTVNPYISLTTENNFHMNNEIEIHNFIVYGEVSDSLTAIGMRVILPESTQYISCEGNDKPLIDKLADYNIVEFYWFPIPKDSIRFSYRINSKSTLDIDLQVYLLYRLDDSPEYVQSLKVKIEAKASEGGTIYPSGDIYIEEGSSQTFMMIANEGYMLEDVIVNGISVGPQGMYNITAVQNSTIYAKFKKIASAEIHIIPDISTDIILNDEILGKSDINGIFNFDYIPGIYTLSITAMDYMDYTQTIELISGDNELINIYLTPKPHQAIAGKNLKVLTGSQVYLDGSQSDNTDNIISYHWSQIGGQVVQLSSPDNKIASFIAPNIEDILVFRLIVTNKEGYQNSDATLIYVNTDPLLPVLKYPKNSAQNERLTPVLEAEEFPMLNVRIDHIETHWQVSQSADFSFTSNYVLDILTKKNLKSLLIPYFVLNKDDTYYWRVKYFDSLGIKTEWSETHSFQTSKESKEEQFMDKDIDGIPDLQTAIDTIDMDNNGINDNKQMDIKSFKTVDGKNHIGFKISKNVESIDYIMSVNNNSFPDTNNKPSFFPIHLISFKLKVKKAEEAEVIIYFSNTFSEWAKWYKYDLINGWHDYSKNSTYNRNSITLRLKDGGYGDIDGIENGVIIDPSGLAEIEKIPENKENESDDGGCFILLLFNE